MFCCYFLLSATEKIILLQGLAEINPAVNFGQSHAKLAKKKLLSSLRAVAATKKKKAALEEDGSGNWGTTF